MRRLLLVRHAPTSSTRKNALPVDEPLDARGRADAAGLAAALPGRCDVALSSPALRCLQTAEAAGLAARVDAGLAECDFGAWGGSTLAELNARDPAAVRRWMLEPDAAPHGGESLTAFAARVAGWLDDQAAGDGTAVAITHGGVVKAAVVHALDAPIEAFWRVDAAPLSVSELHARDGRWTVARVGVAAVAAAKPNGHDRTAADSPAVMAPEPNGHDWTAADSPAVTSPEPTA
jgi:broad specificity phosphatase PhoE